MKKLMSREPEDKQSFQRNAATNGELSFYNSIPFLLRQTHRRFATALEGALQPHGLSPTHWYFLRVLWTEEGLTQAELSGRVGLMTPSAVAVLNSLEKMELIIRRSDPNDKRKYRIFLTDRGRHLESKLMPVARNVHTNLLQRVPAAKLEVVREILRDIVGT